MSLVYQNLNNMFGSIADSLHCSWLNNTHQIIQNIYSRSLKYLSSFSYQPVFLMYYMQGRIQEFVEGGLIFFTFFLGGGGGDY